MHSCSNPKGPGGVSDFSPGGGISDRFWLPYLVNFQRPVAVEGEWKGACSPPRRISPKPPGCQRPWPSMLKHKHTRLLFVPSGAGVSVPPSPPSHPLATRSQSYPSPQSLSARRSSITDTGWPGCYLTRKKMPLSLVGCFCWHIYTFDQTPCSPSGFQPPILV